MLSNASNIAIERGFVLDDGFFCSHVTYNLQLDTRPEKSLYTPLYHVVLTFISPHFSLPLQYLRQKFNGMLAKNVR